MTVSFEGTEYESSITRPDIPYTIYVHADHLLLVPRGVTKVHKEFPPERQSRRYTLKLDDEVTDEYQQKHNRAAKFSSRHVCFGYEEDEGVVVCALLDGSNMILYWDFASMITGEETVIDEHFTDVTSDPESGFRLMGRDLQQAA